MAQFRLCSQVAVRRVGGFGEILLCSLMETVAGGSIPPFQPGQHPMLISARLFTHMHPHYCACPVQLKALLASSAPGHTSCQYTPCSNPLCASLPLLLPIALMRSSDQLPRALSALRTSESLCPHGLAGLSPALIPLQVPFIYFLPWRRGRTG